MARKGKFKAMAPRGGTTLYIENNGVWILEMEAGRGKPSFKSQDNIWFYTGL